MSKADPLQKNSHPSGDRRFKLLEVAIKRQQFRQDALIEILHVAQQAFGYLEPGVLFFVARKLRLPPSRVFGVATFYKLFTLKPQGRHACVVCTGTACYVKGANELLKAIEATARITAGETTPGDEASLVTARCLGACGMAPVVVYDDTMLGQQTADDVRSRWKEWLQNEPATVD
jgi:bidirectional [NiFe] hydrogenase diaphorase subunit